MTQLLLGGAGYFLLNMGISWYMAKDQNGVQVAGPSGDLITVPGNTDDIPAYLLRPEHLNEGTSYRKVPRKVAPIWPMDSYVDIIVTVSPSFAPTALSEVPPDNIVLEESRFKLGNYSDKRSIEAEFTLPTEVQNNGTLWGHFFVGLHGSQLDPARPDYDVANAYFFSYPLTHYFPKKKVAKTRNLLDDLPAPVQVDEEDEGPVVMANYYHPNTTLSLIPNSGVIDFASQHPAARQFLRLEVNSPTPPCAPCSRLTYSRLLVPATVLARTLGIVGSPTGPV